MKVTENENKEIVKRYEKAWKRPAATARAEYSARLRTSACARNSDAR